MGIRISATEFARSLSDVLSRVYYKRETFLIERNGLPIAELIPTQATQRVTVREFAELLAEMPSTDDDFARDIEALQDEQTQIGPPRWG